MQKYPTVRGVAVARITLRGRERSSFPLPTCKTQEQADDRAALLAGLARRFRRAGVTVDDPRARPLLEMAAEKPVDLLPHVMALADQLAGGTLELPEPTDQGPTFKQVADDWTSGKLHERFPDHVGKLTESFQDTAEKRLAKAINPIIGSTPVDKVTRADCDAVMRQLPAPKGKGGLSKKTRRQYAGLIGRVLNLAELAGYIPRSPLPRGWLPKAGARKRFPILSLAKVDRPDPTSTGPNKGRFGTHCFRRSFVTRSLASGMGEDWVRQRSGHKSAALLRYRQEAKALAELAPGEVDPLSLSIPEVAAWGNQSPAITHEITREGGGTGRRASLRC